MELTIEIIVFLFFAAAVAGFVDTLAGGGGLITIPALIIAGIPPLTALGTNKLQGSLGTATASYFMFRNKKVNYADARSMMFMAFTGASLGTITVQFIDTKVLSFVIPIVLLITAVYFILAPKSLETDSKAKLSEKLYQNLVIPIIGFYDGMFGPGTGSFFTLAGVSLRGQGIIKSTAVAKPLNLATNLAALIVFIFAGKVIWLIGFIMLLGQILGAWLGSYSLFKIKPEYLRIIVIVVCISMLVKYALALIEQNTLAWLF